MSTKDSIKDKTIKLINLFESEKHRLQNLPAKGVPNLVFGDVVLLNLDELNPYEGNFIERRAVRSSIPQIFIWLFRQFAPILREIPGYGAHTEEVFGRLGNTVSSAEANAEPLSADEKVAAVFQDFWEICQDLLEGKFSSLQIAFGAEIMDDFVTRSLKSGFVSQEEFEKALFGGSNQ